MGLSGTLTKDNIGFSMPAHAPLFPKPPYAYRGATLLVFKYLTDPDSAARMLPAQAELLDVPDAPGKAVAGLVFASYPSSDLGHYLEVVQFLACVYQGKPVQFATALYVTSDVAMAAGREMGGYPKKMAHIRLHGNDPVHASIERPTGHPLARGTLTGLGPPEPIPGDESVLKYLTLRLIPSPTRDAPPSVSELLLSDWTIEGGTVSKGTGHCEIVGASVVDPLHLAPVHTVFESTLVRADLRVTANDPDPARGRPFSVKKS